MKLDRDSALLWVHGVSRAINPRLNYYQGKRRIPAPLVIRRHSGRSDLTMVGDEILGLSKMNWNSFDLYTKLPATVETSKQIARIGALLERFGSGILRLPAVHVNFWMEVTACCCASLQLHAGTVHDKGAPGLIRFPIGRSARQLDSASLGLHIRDCCRRKGGPPGLNGRTPETLTGPVRPSALVFAVEPQLHSSARRSRKARAAPRFAASVQQRLPCHLRL